MTVVTPHRPTTTELLAWPESELPRIRHLLSLRKYLTGPLYRAIRTQYEAAIDRADPPTTTAEAAEVADRLPTVKYWVWLDRHIQDETWRIVERLVEPRIEQLVDVLTSREGDLGTLEELPAGAALPAYYVDTDFHRQTRGIWPDERAAAVYAMGARVIHVGRNDNFEMHDSFADSLPVERPQRILDLACGFGKTTFSLKKKWPQAEVHGLDLSAPCLRLARRMATERDLEIHWRQGDTEHAPYEDSGFDLVTVTMALHEMPIDSIYGTLREAHRLLRPGGTFCALEARLLNDPLRDLLGAYHSDVIVEPFMNAFRQSDFQQFASAAGFSTEAPHWYGPGTVPGAEDDPTTWANGWTLLIARKDA
ncbi:class I SAM-dependent methyltransferase [Dactylosporangium roseum]|uniref:Class I SAM-dependent methyltransferase n=1 Tax=Dactylosporangium roseum TaxID=47989 RepID=A0ABY5YXM7_9ACTN|nr:class I SAM-dependent methyltransferase [Dactylosporangium roseum]UWZ34510.1 class I SAM-dependent methyltransferase [Dactylosporangium roseum]